MAFKIVLSILLAIGCVNMKASDERGEVTSFSTPHGVVSFHQFCLHKVRKAPAEFWSYACKSGSGCAWCHYEDQLLEARVQAWRSFLAKHKACKH